MAEWVGLLDSVLVGLQGGRGGFRRDPGVRGGDAAGVAALNDDAAPPLYAWKLHRLYGPARGDGAWWQTRVVVGADGGITGAVTWRDDRCQRCSSGAARSWLVDEAWQVLAPRLRSGETLVWWGRPDPAKHFGQSDLFLVPFSLLWGGFAIFWETTVLVRGAPLPFQIFGLAFVVVGLYFIAGRFLAKARRKRRTVYGLTRDRALVAVGPGSFSEVPLAQVPIEQSRSRDGRHLTVVFGRWAGGWLTGPSYANTGMEFFGRDTAQVGFYDVSDVGGLEAALHSLRG